MSAICSKTDEAEGGVIRNGKRWQDGLTWDMFDAGLTTMTKLISKIRKSLPEPYVFNLTAIPEIQARLISIRPNGRMGPVILARRSGGFPTLQADGRRHGPKLRKQEGLPKELWMMDLRAGAMTEAKSLGASPYMLRDAGQHKEMSTTARYSRGRSESENNVARLRNTGK